MSGYISHIQCDEVGLCSLILGGGRKTKEDIIDLRVGLILQAKVADKVEKGQPIAIIHAADETTAKQAAERFLRAVSISEEAVDSNRLIYGILD